MLAVTVVFVIFMLSVAVVMACCCVRTVFVVGVVVTSVRAMMIVVAMVTMVCGCEKCLLGVVPCHVGKNSILDVTSQETLFAERGGILLRIHSPTHIASEEQWSVVS